jgi:hypothetical protein
MTPFQSWLQSRNHNGLPWETSTKELHEAFVAGWMACIEALVANHEPERPRGITIVDAEYMRLIEPEDTPSLMALIPPPTPEEIYQAYPRKEGKTAALKAIAKAIKHRGAHELLKVVKEYAAAVALWPESEKRYRPMPATWFNEGRYDDDPQEWQRSAAAGSQFGKTH